MSGSEFSYEMFWNVTLKTRNFVKRDYLEPIDIYAQSNGDDDFDLHWNLEYIGSKIVRFGRKIGQIGTKSHKAFMNVFCLARWAKAS